MIKHLKTRLAVAAVALSLCMSAFATDVTGAGSSFVYPVLSKWSATWAAETGNHVNYQSIGSGGGIAQIKAGTVTFGASDAPLSGEELDKHGLGQFPIVIGGIVPVLHVEGIKPGQLTLDGKTLADIFLGNITHWNDPAIAALNPGVPLPDTKIIVVHRSDGSGTSFNFTDYLSKVSPAWKEQVGRGKAVKWPAGIGGKGNEGVSAYVRQFENSIGYVEYAYAVQNKLAYAALKNAAGMVVKPSQESFAAAAASADWSHAKDFNLLMTNAGGDKAWPITATTWVIMYKQPKNAARSKTARQFFRWALEHGQPQASKLDYVPLPDSLVQRIENYWKVQFQ